MDGKQMVKFNTQTRDALRDWQTANGLTLKQVGARLGRNEGFMSKYLNGVPEGDIDTFETYVTDLLALERRKRTWADIYFPTEAVSTCHATFDLIRGASDIGLIYGPAGVGKSIAVKRYAAEYGLVISFTGAEGRGSPWDVQRGIATGIDMRKWDHRQTKLADYLQSKLTDSGRLVIIDNAQRINRSGLRWIIDFHDATRVSFALVGNPDVLDKLKGKDQLVSRIGVRSDIARHASLAGGWIDRAADDMLAAMWPPAAADIALLARETARLPGHLRTLNKQLRIAMELCETELYRGKYARAFVEARHLIGVDDESD